MLALPRFVSIVLTNPQAKRHALGSADLGYALRNTLNTPESSTLSNIRDRVLIGFHILEAFIVPPTSGWVLTLGGLMFNLYIRTADFTGEPIIIAMIYAVAVLAIAAPAPLVICCIVYEFYHRMVNRTLYRKNGDGSEGKHDEVADQTRHLGHLLDYAALPIGAMLYTTLPHTLASFQRLWPSASHTLAYVTSEKMVDEAILRRD
jgi:hypothetical protein